MKGGTARGAEEGAAALARDGRDRGAGRAMALAREPAGYHHASRLNLEP